MNSTEAIRRKAKMERSPEDKGWKATIEIYWSDGGLMNVNGRPIGPHEVAQELALANVVMAYVTDFVQEVAKADRKKGIAV